MKLRDQNIALRDTLSLNEFQTLVDINSISLCQTEFVKKV